MKYRNANIWVMSLLFIMSGVFCTANCFESVFQCLNMCLNIMLENETDFEFVFGHFLLTKVVVFFLLLICKETSAHTKTNVRGSFEKNLFFNLASHESYNVYIMPGYIAVRGSIIICHWYFRLIKKMANRFSIPDKISSK